jgi:hypothetical protein
MTTEETSQDPTEPGQIEHFDDGEPEGNPGELEQTGRRATGVSDDHEEALRALAGVYQDAELDDREEEDEDDEEEDDEEGEFQDEQDEGGDSGSIGDGAASTGRPEAQLQEIVEAAKESRLAPGDENRAIELLEQTITGGPKALPATLDAILTLPWNLGVKAVTEAWPETKPAGRTRLLTGLAKADSDVSRRIRLSLARGLHAQDPASAFKLLLGVCEAMGGAQGGSSTKDRQIFANVMLGKARPWLMNIAMADLKPAEAQKLITPALESCHQAPIFTQIWVLRWICDAGKFETLPPEHIDSIGKSINRWQPRWRKELRKIIPKLPEPLEAVLVDSENRRGPVSGVPVTAATPTGEADFPVADEGARDEDAAESADEEPRSHEVREPAMRSRAPEPIRSRDRQQAAQGPFDLNRSLRDIEAYVVRLRGDLQQAQLAARRREPAPDRGRGRVSQTSASAEEFDELRRHNAQLEAQNEELVQRIEELTNDHEDRASTLEIADPLEQFKTYLGLKLKEDFADYTAISRESLTEVVRRHAHEVLGRVFEVLKAEGVKFEKKE